MSEQVLTATVELISQHGVAAVTYDAVAKLAGTSRATVYRKWPERDDLLKDALMRFAESSKPAERPVAVTGQGPRSTLILQNRRDNATPWEGGLGLHKALGDSSAFVGVDNGGHYVFGEGSGCADKATIDFLTTGHLPGKDVYCTDVKRKPGQPT